METIVKILTEYELVTVLILFVLFCLSIKGVIDFIGWIRGKLEEWRKRKNEPEDKEENMLSKISSLETRIEKLERHDQSQYEKLKNIDTKLDEIKEDNRKQTVAQNRSALMRIYHEVKARNSITPEEYETFHSLAENYLICGGNGMFRNHIIPEVENMDIKV